MADLSRIRADLKHLARKLSDLASVCDRRSRFNYEGVFEELRIICESTAEGLEKIGQALEYIEHEQIHVVTRGDL